MSTITQAVPGCCYCCVPACGMHTCVFVGMLNRGTPLACPNSTSPTHSKSETRKRQPNGKTGIG
ncbi:uncharacterized protein BDZ83DRAFT_614397 [Colletotrichum acutatum]|uniref:Uncharacterized protein n=1 Tax=Glomerella acutata TaxID=27357 RepID=A0AAD8XH10_GLOAC|nr:uncharacterized protein BDZ83DRAFT_614397 [Colletotrichum acutatum]KAK1726927.1 hypothetical protein BDZ83DRAFT_614397 [Colletotrichum acutatum]